ncbi:MAG: hypothetical protein OS130_00230 [Thermodesulfobacteriota bacterium]|jgi:outer membrane lipoprotein-sorting protein|nr:MAG: hypothetical protein OS130_00230 [Thermodesulfobacteriota bacterium]
MKAHKAYLIASIVLVLMVGTGLEFPPEIPDNDHVFRVIKKMVTEFNKIENLTCETEVHFYNHGEPSDYYWIKFSCNKAGLIRVDFFHPFKGTTAFYQEGADFLTVRPFRSMPWVKIEFSIENSLVKTPSGQRIDQTAVKHFLKFIINNRQVIEKNEHSAAEDGDQITFTFWALDYIQGNDLERYILQVSKQNWLPMQVDRFDKENRPVETTSFKKVAINIGLRDDFFVP